jgi:hypothetical protein
VKKHQVLLIALLAIATLCVSCSTKEKVIGTGDYVVKDFQIIEAKPGGFFGVDVPAATLILTEDGRSFSIPGNTLFIKGAKYHFEWFEYRDCGERIAGVRTRLIPN